MRYYQTTPEKNAGSKTLKQKARKVTLVNTLFLSWECPFIVWKGSPYVWEMISGLPWEVSTNARGTISGLKTPPEYRLSLLDLGGGHLKLDRIPSRFVVECPSVRGLQLVWEGTLSKVVTPLTKFLCTRPAKQTCPDRLQLIPTAKAAALHCRYLQTSCYITIYRWTCAKHR